MRQRVRISTAVWLLTGLAMLTSPAWGQTTIPTQNGQVDQLRLEGANDRGGDRGSNRSGRGGSDNSGPGSANSGQGSGNSGPGSANSGSGRGGSDNSGPGSMNSGRGFDNGGSSSASSGRDDVRNVNDDRRENRHVDRQVDRRSNSGGELRGLDRAAQVAGDHGQQGRDHARDVQMERANRPDRLDHQQRPEHPDRAQRSDRPERHDRSGHN